MSTGQSICVDPASLLSFLLASYEAPPSCVSSTLPPPSLFQSNWNPHTTTKSPMSNLLNKLHAPSAAVKTFVPDKRTSCCKVGLRAERLSSPFRSRQHCSSAPRLVFEARAEEIKGSFNKELSWLPSYAGHSGGVRRTIQMRAAGAKRCVLLGIIIDTEANKDKSFFFFKTTVLRFGNEIDCGPMVVRCFSIVPTSCLHSKYTPSFFYRCIIDYLR